MKGLFIKSKFYPKSSIVQQDVEGALHYVCLIAVSISTPAAINSSGDMIGPLQRTDFSCDVD